MIRSHFLRLQRVNPNAYMGQHYHGPAEGNRILGHIQGPEVPATFVAIGQPVLPVVIRTDFDCVIDGIIVPLWS